MQKSTHYQHHPHLLAPAFPISHRRSHALSEQEQYLMAVARAILDGEIRPTMETVFIHLEEPLQALARELCSAYHHYGLEGFWKSYDAYDDIPHKLEIRLLLETDQEERHGALLSKGEDQAVDWLWQPRLAAGKITTLMGAPGSGRTSLAVDIAARVTMGAAFPDGTVCSPGGVVLIAPEDSLWDSLQPRLVRAKADLKRIVSVSCTSTIDPVTGYMYERPFTLLDDLPLLERAIQRVQARLVIIDPFEALTGYQPVVSDHDLQASLVSVQALLRQYQTACLLIHRPPASGTVRPLHSYSSVLAGYVRTMLAIETNPAIQDGHLLTQRKNAMGTYAPPLAFRVVHDCQTTGNAHPYVIWEAPLVVQNQGEIVLPGSPIYRDIQAHLQKHYPQALSTSDIAAALPHWKIGQIRAALFKMFHQHQITKMGRGRFVAVG